MSTTPKQVWPLVIKDMIARNEMGAEKYNRYLQTDCPDNMLQHAYEEALDLAVYLKTQIEKKKLKDQLNALKSKFAYEQEIAKEKLNAVKREEEKTNGLKEISGMDPNNCCISGCGEEHVQRNSVPSTWFIF